MDPNSILGGLNVGDIETVLGRLEEADVPCGPMSGIEMALWDLIGKKADLPVCRLMGGILRSEIEFTACMGLKEPSESAETARIYLDRWGFQYQKTKAGNDAGIDLAIASAVQKEIGDEIFFRPDANGGYDPVATVDLMARFGDLGVKFFEDPCPPDHAEALAAVRSDTPISVLVNMGVTDPSSVRPILEAGAADFLMPDTPSSGALIRCRAVSSVAQAFDVQCLMHSAHDLGLKTAAITHIAASTPNWTGPNDTCYHGLTDDVLVEPFKFEGGKLRVPEAPGLGVEVDESKISNYAVS